MTRKEPAPAVRLAAQLTAECHKRIVYDERKHEGKSVYAIARDAEELVRLAKRATSLAVRQCNGVIRWEPGATRPHATWTEADESACERAKERIRKRADEILQPYGGKVLTISGDPRGCVMRLSLASGAQNGFGEGWGL